MAQTKTKPTYKYKIKELMARMTPTQCSKVKKKMLKGTEANPGISKNTYYRYVGLLYEDNNDIPGKTLQQFAECLNVNVEDLFN